ncbi:MAG: hypothetical protein HZB91_09115, partial [Elusimicrobia bacterium]|nr:hypothetical protein [Elusimicrobiota bacterium]
SDAARYWAFQAVASDPGPWTPARLSAAVGLPAASAAAALADLAAAGLAARREDGSFTSPFFNRLAIQSRSADDDARAPSFIPRIRRHWDKVASKRGRLLFHQYILIRASESDAAAYFPYLAQSLHGLEAYETVEKGPDTAFLVAEGTVRRLMPF